MTAVYRYNCFLCNFDICSGCAKSIEAQNIGQDKTEPRNTDGTANGSQRVAEFGCADPSSPHLDEEGSGLRKTEKEMKMELNIMEEMREELNLSKRVIHILRVLRAETWLTVYHLFAIRMQ